jgi:hypothetical protein
MNCTCAVMSFWSRSKTQISIALITALSLFIPLTAFAAWSTDPIDVAASTVDQRRPQVVYDGSGGYYISWQEYSGEGVFAQHYDAQGNATWAAPVHLSSAADDYAQQESTADGLGGLLVAWTDADDYTRVQRVDINGNVAWAAEGVQILSDGDSWIAADGTGGAIVMSYDGGTVNRITADGTLPWGDADNAISFSSNWWATKIVSDGNGGAILLWVEESAFSGVAVQRIDSDGNFLWNSGNPVQLSADGASPDCPRIIPANGGAIVIWYDSSEVLAQKVDSAGAVQWTAGGVVLTSGVNPGDLGLASDGAGGAFFTWAD